MKRFRAAHYLLCLVLLFGMLGGLFADRIVFAAEESNNNSSPSPSSEEQPPPEEKLTLFCQYPVLQGIYGSSFEFEISLRYYGSEPTIFDFALTVPSGWDALIAGGYPEKVVSAIELNPEKTYPDTVKVRLRPLPENPPEPGDYVVIFEAGSDDLKKSVELKAIITEIPSTYSLDMSTVTLRRQMQAKAGKDNHISIQLTNYGTGVLKNIVFSSVKPEGWSVTFSPSKLESLEFWVSQEVDVAITPPRNTEAGDYPIILKAVSEKTDSSFELRVTVLTSTIWGGAGIGIAVAVIAGLVVLFRRLGRR